MRSPELSAAKSRDLVHSRAPEAAGPDFPPYKLVRTTDLLPYAQNARTHSPAQIAQIVASVGEWGWTNPVLIDEQNGLIAGHGRLLAAKSMGIAEIPAIVVGGLTAAQKRALVLADNKLALNAGWDNATLALELTELKDVGFDLDLIGFNEDELTGLLSLGCVGLTDPDDVPAVQTKTVSEPGDVWLLGRHRLVCGDCTDASAVAAALGGVEPHLLVTDPPYGVEYDASWRVKAGINGNTAKLGKVQNDNRADWSQAWALFPGDVAYVWHGALHAAVVAKSLELAGFAIRAQVIWAKDRMVLSRGHYHWQHEPCWYAVRGTGHWSGDRKQTTLWQIRAREDGGHGHSTQKPVECMRRPIENNSAPGQAVYEPFCGSGTTIIAAETSGRACHAIEVSPTYVDVTIRRWQQFTGHDAFLERDGRSFSEVEVSHAG